MTRLLAVAWAAALLACSSSPVIREGHLTISTKSGVEPLHEVLGPVSTSYCDHLVLLVLPVVGDQREVYGELLGQARRMGGHAVIDFRLSLKDTLYFVPLYFKGCWHAEATAIRFR